VFEASSLLRHFSALRAFFLMECAELVSNFALKLFEQVQCIQVRNYFEGVAR
jgi:hypothetical protein